MSIDPAQLSCGDVLPEDLGRLPTAVKLQLVLGTTETASVYQSGATRNPVAVFRLCSDLLIARGGSGLSEAELHLVREVGVQAALDQGQVSIAGDWLLQLSRRFGKDAPRVLRLRGMYEEAQGDYPAAVAHYERVRDNHPLDMWPVKRLCAVHKARGRLAEAAALLESTKVFVDRSEDPPKSYPFRQLHPLDDGTLRELISLHWQLDNVAKCIFYQEELLLLDPHSFLFYSRLGELCYAAGSVDRAVSAYSQSVRLNPHANNARAVLGLWQSCLEWRRVKQLQQQQLQQRGGSSSSGGSTGTRRLDDIDDGSVTAAASAGDVTEADGNTSSVALTGAMVGTLLGLAETSLKQHYQNSPLLSVLELTLRRYGASK
jgi:tetratricopeptide (TPR) repeat protein